MQNAGLLDQLAPARDLAVDELLELRRRRRDLRHRALFGQQVLHLRVLHHLADLSRELVDDVLRPPAPVEIECHDAVL